MTILAGQKVTAAELNRLRTKKYHGECTTALTKTDATFADIAGCSITLTTETAGATYSVVGIFDCAVGTSSASTRMLGRLNVDGAIGTGFGVHEMDNLDRDTVGMTWQGTLAAAGAHTIKLQGALSAAAGSGTFQLFTRILVFIDEVV